MRPHIENSVKEHFVESGEHETKVTRSLCGWEGIRPQLPPEENSWYMAPRGRGTRGGGTGMHYLHDLKQKIKTQRSRFPCHSQLYTKFPDTMHATLIGTLAVLIFCQLNMIT